MNHHPMEVDSAPTAPTSTSTTSGSPISTSLPPSANAASPSPGSATASSPAATATVLTPPLHPPSNFSHQTAVLAQAIPVSNNSFSGVPRPVMASPATSPTPATIAHTAFGGAVQPTTATAVAATPAILTVSPHASSSGNVPHTVAVRANIAHSSTIVSPSTSSNLTSGSSGSQGFFHTTSASTNLVSNAIPAVSMAARPIATATAIPAVNINSGTQSSSTTYTWKQGSPVLGSVTPPGQHSNTIPAASLTSTSASTSPHPTKSRSSTTSSSVWHSSSSHLRKPLSRSPSPKIIKGMTKSSSTSSLDSLADLAALAAKAPAYSTSPTSNIHNNPYQPKFSINIPTHFSSLPNPAISPLSALAQVVSQDSALGSFDSRFDAFSISSNSLHNVHNDTTGSAQFNSFSSSGMPAVPILGNVQSDYPPPTKSRTLSANIKTNTRMRSPSSPLPSSEIFQNLRHRTRRQYQRIGIDQSRT